MFLISIRIDMGNIYFLYIFESTAHTHL